MKATRRARALSLFGRARWVALFFNYIMRIMKEFLLSIDWLSFSAIKLDGAQHSNKYEWRELEYSSRQFAKIYQVIKDRELLFEVQEQPFSKIIDANMVIIKVSNYRLYTPNFLREIDQFCTHCGYKLHNISRIDICCDMLSFKTISCEELIEGCVSNRLVKLGRCNKMQPFMYRNDGGWRYEGCAWGSRQGAVYTRLYNKTKELREVKDKPYIRDYWQRALKGYAEDPSQDVWRLEFECDCNIARLVSKDTGEFAISCERIGDSIAKTFAVLIHKYFRFAIGSFANATRAEKADLIDGEVDGGDFIYYNACSGASKSERIAVHAMWELVNRGAGVDGIAKEVLQRGLLTLVEYTGLSRWYANKTKWWLRELDPYIKH